AAANGSPSAAEDSGRVGVISAQVHPAEIYVRVHLGGRQILTILVTGCERSIIGKSLIPDLQLTDTGLSLFAANGTSIPLVGAVTLTFDLEGHPASTNVVVTEALDELILGIDWLSTHRCQWDLGTATLKLNGREIPVYKRPTRASVRRIFVSDAQVLPPGHQNNVTVRVIRNGMREPRTFEPKALQRGLVVARTLLQGDATQAVIRVVN